MIIALNHELKEKGQLFIGPISKKNVLSEISLVVVKEGIIKGMKQKHKKDIAFQESCKDWSFLNNG